MRGTRVKDSKSAYRKVELQKTFYCNKQPFIILLLFFQTLFHHFTLLSFLPLPKSCHHPPILPPLTLLLHCLLIALSPSSSFLFFPPSPLYFITPFTISPSSIHSHHLITPPCLCNFFYHTSITLSLHPITPTVTPLLPP